MKIAPDESQEILVFQLNDELAEFEELELGPDVKLYELLKSELILFFVNPSKYRSYIWAGRDASVRMKFIAANAASNVRDRIGPAIKISTVDEDEETTPFKILIGLEEEKEYVEEQTGPAYSGSEEEDSILQNMTLEKIVLLLEKIGCPEGYEREMVIDGKNIYGYHEYYTRYLGQVIKEKKLYRLEEKVSDGPYFAEGLVPRILMSYNKVVIVELLRKMTPEESDLKESELEKLEEIKQTENPFTS